MARGAERVEGREDDPFVDPRDKIYIKKKKLTSEQRISGRSRRDESYLATGVTKYQRSHE